MFAIIVGAVGLISNLLAHRPWGGQRTLGSIGSLCFGGALLVIWREDGGGGWIARLAIVTLAVLGLALFQFDKRQARTAHAADTIEVGELPARRQ